MINSQTALTDPMAMYDAFSTGEGDESRSVAGLLPLLGVAREACPTVYLLDRTDHVIGREPGVSISINASSMSRRHARLQREKDGWYLVDLQSRNGTYLDGLAVSTTRLTEGALVRTGDVVFKFILKNAQQYQGYRTDGTLEAGTRRLSQQTTTLLGGAQMDRVVANLERIAPTDLSVILYGETGTGKEVAAKEIHRLSGRRGPFVAVNCAAIPGPLLESELFGYRKGAFSGADRDKVGLVKAAHQGTLFLDEIGDMPLDAQAKLLRILQAREVLPLGATVPEVVDVRVLCATHRDLTERQAAGLFRGDLFARLQEYVLLLSPLRARKEDIPLLAHAMLARHGRPDLTPDFGFLLGLLHYGWPFNVRELEACLKRALALADGPVLNVDHLPDALRSGLLSYQKPGSPVGSSLPSVPPPDAAESLAVASSPLLAGNGIPSEEQLRALLLAHQGNVTALARVFGKERMQIHRWMKRYQLDPRSFRSE